MASSSAKVSKMKSSSRKNEFKKEFRTDEYVHGSNKRYRKNKLQQKREAAPMY